MERKGLKVVQRRIDILENRISAITVESWNSDVYTHRQYCLHSYLLLGEYANRYYLLSQDLFRQKEDWEVDHPEKPFPDPGTEWSDRIMEKTWNTLETGYHVAVKYLPVNDVVRLLLSYEYCCFLWRHGDDHEEAKTLAIKAYEEASSLSFELDSERLTVLEKIRNDLLVSKKPKLLLQAYGEAQDNESVEAEPSLRDDHGDKSKTRKSFILRKKSVKFAELDKLRDTRASIGAYNRNLEVANMIKKFLSGAVANPTYLDAIPSSSIILKTIDKIFRAYIRGNALPGQLTSGNTVDMAGNTISFGTFVLNGPYMSWKGFLQFLIDFGIAQLPPQHSKNGQKFWKTMSTYKVDVDAAMTDQAMAGGTSRVEPVLSLKEAALIFIQCSGAAYPALISRRTNNQRSKNNDNDDGPNPDNIEAESWRLTTHWAENDGHSEWEIDVGTNFPQFLDCLGKMGIVAYSKDHFSAILPTLTEKIEHFLSAFLGLTDQRKWFSKVQRKLKSASSAIKDVAERAKAVTTKKSAT